MIPSALCHWLSGGFLILFTLSSHADTVPPMAAVVQNKVDEYLRTQTRGLPGRVSYTIGALESRTHLSPCPALEAFSPPGARPWGNTTVGIRCQGSQPWTVYVPVQISVTTNYLVASRPIPPGQKLLPEDVSLQSGDLANLPSSVLTDLNQATGKVTKSAIGAGQPVRSELLAAPLVIQQGQSVRLVIQGPGFSVTNDGKALNNAQEGQIVQVRTATGQTVSGTARPGGVVEVSN